MSLENRSVDPSDIKPYHAEQLQQAIATLVDAELQERDLNPDDDADGDDTEPEPVRVGLDELARGCPLPAAKCRVVMDGFAGEPGTGIERVEGGCYTVDPTA
jgi:hypothetical protein